MGRKRKEPGDKPKKKKRVSIDPANRLNAGKIITPYRIMENLINTVCGHLKEAKIAIALRKGWPAVNGRIKLGDLKMASDCDRAYKDFDFLLLLNSELYRNGTASEESLTMTIHHFLLSGTPDLDRDGNQRIDEKDRKCWKKQKPPIVEFPEIIKTYGLEKTIGLTAEAIAAINDSKRTLLAEAEGKGKAGGNGKAEKAEAEKGDISEGTGEVIPFPATATASDEPAAPTNPSAWKRWKVDCLSRFNLGENGLPDGKVKLLEEAGLGTMGKLVTAMRREGGEDFWWKSIPRFGESGYDALTSAMIELRARKPEFQADEAEGQGHGVQSQGGAAAGGNW